MQSDVLVAWPTGVGETPQAFPLVSFTPGAHWLQAFASTVNKSTLWRWILSPVKFFKNLTLTPLDWKMTETGQIKFFLSLKVGSILSTLKICDSLSWGSEVKLTKTCGGKTFAGLHVVCVIPLLRGSDVTKGPKFRSISPS